MELALNREELFDDSCYVTCRYSTHLFDLYFFNDPDKLKCIESYNAGWQLSHVKKG